MAPSLTIEALTKRFGSVVAVDDLSFGARPGLVTGLVGPNGSGKSTTMRAVLGLVRPSSGRPLVNGRPYHELTRPLAAVGAVLDAGAVNPGLTGATHLRWMCRTHGSPRRGPNSCSTSSVSRARPIVESAGTRWACGSGSASPPP